MRVLVLGAAGMLGHKLLQRLDADEVVGTVRRAGQAAETARQLPGSAERRVLVLDARDGRALDRVLEEVRPDVVVNAIGLVKQRGEAEDAVAAIEVNALLPQRLAAWCGRARARLIHFSTDCVFQGTRGGYTEADTPDARELYGRSKLLGEATESGCLTLRTSMIGRELATSQGLVEWFLGEAGGSVTGYAHARFSGLPTVVLADTVSRIIREHPALTGLYHVAAAPIAKHALLQLLDAAYATGTVIVADEAVRIDRSLDGTRFHEATGISFPAWEALVERMAADPTPYEEIRRGRT